MLIKGRSFTVEKLPDEPIVIVRFTLPPRLDIEKMFQDIASQVNDTLDGVDGRVFRLNDISLFDRINIFNQIVRGLAFEVKGIPGSNSDPRISPAFVGKGANVRLLVEALRQEQYGGLDVPAFPTLDEALAQVRQWIAEGELQAVRE